MCTFWSRVLCRSVNYSILLFHAHAYTNRACDEHVSPLNPFRMVKIPMRANDGTEEQNLGEADFWQLNFHNDSVSCFTINKEINDIPWQILFNGLPTDQSYVQFESQVNQIVFVINTMTAQNIENEGGETNIYPTSIINFDFVHCSYVISNVIVPNIKPRLPHKGSSALVEYLSSDELMFHIGFSLGLKDLILTQEHPASHETVGRSFLAVVGALNASSGLNVTQQFIQDFVITQLVGKNITEIWQISEKFGCRNSGLLEQIWTIPVIRPELHLSALPGHPAVAAQTIFDLMYSCYKSVFPLRFGETVSTATDQAAHNVLNTLFHTTDSKEPLPLGKKGKELTLRRDDNMTIKDWSLENANNIIQC
ncbi:unnamed protein product, partial [Meganyctiphanes norvegica]